MIAIAIGVGRRPLPAAGAAPTASADSGLARDRRHGARAARGRNAHPRPTVLELRVPIVPVLTSDPASTLIRLAVQRQPSGMFVYGDVYVARVTWVFVSLRDPFGDRHRVGVGERARRGRARRPRRPTMRFDVELAVPADSPARSPSRRPPTTAPAGSSARPN